MIKNLFSLFKKNTKTPAVVFSLKKTCSLSQLEKETGYTKDQLLKAMQRPDFPRPGVSSGQPKWVLEEVQEWFHIREEIMTAFFDYEERA